MASDHRSNRIFLDANVLLEILLDRKNTVIAKQIVEQYAGQSYISSLTGHLIVYYTAGVVDLEIIRKFLDDYTMLDLSHEDFNWAFQNIHGTDFEDALQLAVAIRANCSKFITFDQTLYKKYRYIDSIEVVLATSSSRA